jgi:hypothetical protein
MRIVSRQALTWEGNTLFFKRRKMAGIEQDARYPKMWRVKYPDGRLSGMVNLTRARDAATVLALAALNSRGEETGAAAPPMRFAGEPVPGQPGEGNNAPAEADHG